MWRTALAVKKLFLLIALLGCCTSSWTAPGRKAQPTPRPTPRSTPPPESLGVLSTPPVPSVRVLSTDQMAIRVPAGRIQCVPPRTGRDVPGPILGLRGPDGIWRGGGWIEGATPVVAIDGSPEGGEYVVTYAFEQGGRAEVRFRVPPAGDHIQVTEDCSNCTSTWVLSFGENFGADTVLAKPVEADEWSGIRHVRPSGQLRHGRLVLWSQFGRLLDFNDWMGVFGGRAQHDFFAFLRVHADAWNRPALNFLSLWERNGALRLEGNWQTGRREWLLIATSRNGDRAEDARARIRALERQWVWNRDGWVLDWNEPITQYRPDLTESERRDKELVLAELERLETSLSERGYLAPPDTRPFVPVYQTYARLKQLGVLRPDEDRRARHALAALAYDCYSKDVFPWDRAMVPPGHPDSLEPLFRGLADANFNAERVAIVGDLGTILARHPMGHVWSEHAADQFRLLLKSYVYPGGFWEDGFSGACDALLFLTPLALRARPAGNGLLAEPRFRSMWDLLLQTVTPPDAEQGGWRSLPPVGEVPAPSDVRDLLLLGASAYSGEDPLFAGRLLWLHKELGGTAKEDPGRRLNALSFGRWAKGGDGAVLGLPANLTSVPQTLSSVNVPGFGAILRGRELTGDETCLVLRNGLAWGRSHNDEGSIQLWAKGVALVADAGRGGAGGWQTIARGHSRVAVSDFEPASQFDGTQYGYKTSYRGQVRSFVSFAGADYVCGVIPTLGQIKRDLHAPYSRQPGVQPLDKPFIQRRHILFLKPDYFVLRDEMQGEAAHDLWLHVNADRVTMPTSSTGVLSGFTGLTDVFGGRATPLVSFENRRGIALDAFILEPRGAQLTTGEVRTTEGLTRYLAVAGSEEGNPDYRTVLYPRRKSERQPLVKLLSPGIVEVDHKGGWDLIILDGSLRSFRSRLCGVALEASIAVVRQRGSAWTAVLIAGRSIELPGLTIRPSVPVSLSRDRHGIITCEVFDHDKPAVIQLEGRWLSHVRLRIEGQPIQTLKDESALIKLPASVNRFTIE